MQKRISNFDLLVALECLRCMKPKRIKGLFQGVEHFKSHHITFCLAPTEYTVYNCILLYFLVEHK